MNVVLIMQARLGSTRLPGKVLKEILPKRTMLDLTLERLKGCVEIKVIVVAVPESDKDTPVAEEARRCGAQVFRGDEADVLSRYLGAAHEAKADMVVRVTSDCPLSDPAVIDLHVQRMKLVWQKADFVTNMAKQSFPLGLAAEAMPIDTLERMSRLSQTPYLREHVTTLAYERPDLFAIESVRDKVDRSHMRWTVDYPQDLEFVRAVFQQLYKPGHIFSKEEIVNFLAGRRDVSAINANVAPH